MKSRGRREVLHKGQPPEVTPVRGAPRKEAGRFAVEASLSSGEFGAGAKNNVEV